LNKNDKSDIIIDNTKTVKNSYNDSDNNSEISNTNKRNITVYGRFFTTDSNPSCMAAWLWALNPLAINICTRGSADSLTNCMVLMLILILLQQGI
jgi:hypothetical protein